MKSSFLAAGILACLLTGSLSAQTNSSTGGSTGPDDHRQRMIGFLSPADQDRVIAAYNKAMADDPDLKTAQEDLRQQHESLQSGSDEDRQAFMEKARAYQLKLRAAMLRADPTLGTVLKQIDAHRAALQGQRQDATGNGSTQ